MEAVTTNQPDADVIATAVPDATGEEAYHDEDSQRIGWNWTITDCQPGPEEWSYEVAYVVRPERPRVTARVRHPKKRGVRLKPVHDDS